MKKIEKNCLKIIRLSFYLILAFPLVILPFFFYYLAVGPSFSFMFLSELIFFIWLFLAIFFPKYRPKKNAVSIALALFLLISITSTILGANPCRSFWSNYGRMRGALMWIHFFALFIATASVFKKRDWLNFMFFSATIATIASLTSWVSNIPFLHIANGLSIQNGSFAGNTSFLASYLLFNLYFAILVIFSIKKKEKIIFFNIDKENGLWKILLCVDIVVMTISLMASDGRAAIISFFGGLALLVLLWLSFQSKKKKTKIIGRVGLIFAIIIFIITVSLLFVPHSMVQKKFAQKGGQARLIVWQEAWQAFLERPILGWGPENLEIATNKYFNPSLMLTGEYQFDRAHNIVFDTLIETGVLGFIAYFSIFISALHLLWKKYFRKKLDFWAVAVPSVLIVAHFTKNLSVFDTPNSFIMLSLLLAFIVSVTTSNSNEEEYETPREVNKKTASAFVFLLFLAFSFFSYILIQKPASANMAMRKFYSILAQDEQPSLKIYKKVLYGSPMSKYNIPNYLSTSLSSKIEKKKVPVDRIKIIEQAMNKNIESSPLDYYNYVFLGNLYNIHGFNFDKSKFKQAERVLETAIQVSPNNQLAYWKLAKSKAMLGKDKEAIDLAKKAVELEPKLMSAHIFLINLYKDLGKQNLANQATEQAYTAPIGETIAWNNPESGHSGSVTPTREGQTDSGDYCRQYKQSIVIDGQVETAYGTACKQGADWVLVN